MPLLVKSKLIASFLCIMMALSLCTKLDSQDLHYNQSVEARRIIEFSVKKGLSIRDVYIKNGLIIISLSNAEEFCVSVEFTCLVRIGADGYWYLNGSRSDCKWEEIEGEEIEGEEIVARQYEYMNTRQSGNETINPCLSCIIESYVDWAFSFTNGETITVVKMSYSHDYDAVLRGVNHRGYCKIAPENTLPAYRLSRLEGFTYVETDVRFTADGVPVCLHDASVDRTSNGSGSVKDMTLAQLQELDFGQWKGGDYAGTNIPTLQEFLELCQSIGLVPYIELKVGSAAQVSEVVSLVEQYNLKGKAVYISFSVECLKYVLLSDQSARVGYLTSLLNEDVIKKAEELRCLSFDSSQVFIDSSDYSTEAVSLCESNSIPLEVWTIDSESSILSLSPYISGVTSNRVHAGRVLWDQRR